MDKRKFINFWSIAVGSMDAITGLLLVIAPAQTLKLLGIEPPSQDALVYLSWVGVFVGAVGLSYAMVMDDRRRGRTVWMITAMVRALVAIFVISQIALGTLVVKWAVVALTDAVVAIVQTAVIRSGWWQEYTR